MVTPVGLVRPGFRVPLRSFCHAFWRVNVPFRFGSDPVGRTGPGARCRAAFSQPPWPEPPETRHVLFFSSLEVTWRYSSDVTTSSSLIWEFFLSDR